MIVPYAGVGDSPYTWGQAAEDAYQAGRAAVNAYQWARNRLGQVVPPINRAIDRSAATVAREIAQSIAKPAPSYHFEDVSNIPAGFARGSGTAGSTKLPARPPPGKSMALVVAGPLRKHSTFARPAPSARPGYWMVPRTTGGLTGTDQKYFDSGIGATSVNQNGAGTWTGTEYDPATLLTLFAPVPGTGINQRIARKCWISKMKIHGLLEQPAVTGGTQVYVAPSVRVIWYQDTQANGLQAQGEDVMTGTPGVAATQAALVGFMSLANLGRFKILKDKTFHLRGGQTNNNNAASTVSWSHDPITFKWSRKFNQLQVDFNAGVAGTIADVVNHAFHMIAVSSADTASNLPNLSYFCRTYYKG